MLNPNRFTDDDRQVVLKCLAEEQQRKAEGKTYHEAVILACEMVLCANPDLHAVKPTIQNPHDPQFWYQQGDMA